MAADVDPHVDGNVKVIESSPPSPSPIEPPSGAGQHNELLGLRKRDLFMRANYTKIMILFKSLITSCGSFGISLFFVWRSYGLVDLISTYSNYSRYLLILILGRAIVWTIFLIVFIVSLQPLTDQSWSNPKVLRIIKSNVLIAILGALFMLVAGAYFLPEWTSSSTYTGHAVNDTSSTSVGDGITNHNSTDTSDTRASLDESSSFWDDHPRTSKTIVLAAYAFSDYIASVISHTVFHPRPSVRVLLKQLRVNIFPTAVTLFWFFSIV